VSGGLGAGGNSYVRRWASRCPQVCSQVVGGGFVLAQGDPAREWSRARETVYGRKLEGRGLGSVKYS
jgi:hypothetical protein